MEGVANTGEVEYLELRLGCLTVGLVFPADAGPQGPR